MTKLYKYPSSLIPHKGLKKEIDIDEILKTYDDFGVARRVEKDIENYIEYLGDDMYVLSHNYKVDHIKDPIDMSMNILTTTSGIEEAKFLQIKKPSCESWNGENIDIKSCKNLLKFNTDCHFLIYKASKLHNKPGTYTRKYKNKDAFQIDQAIMAIDEEFSKDADYQLTFKVRLHHKPTNCNYWHITLDILAPHKGTEGKILKDKKKKWLDDSDLLDYIWNTYICKNFCLDTNPCMPLDDRIAIDNKVNVFMRMYNSIKTTVTMLNVYVPEHKFSVSQSASLSTNCNQNQ